MKPHIVIDARLYGPKHTGLGRYTKNLLLNLPAGKFNYTLLIYPELANEIKKDLGAKFNYVITNIRHYTPAEQIRLPLLLHSLRPDLVHFTHFSKPILYWGKSVVTVHDLIPLVAPAATPRALKRRLFPLYRRLMHEVGARADRIDLLARHRR